MAFLRTRLALTLTALFAAAVAGGCASSGYQQAGKTSDQMGSLKVELEKGANQIDATIASLNGLVGAADLPKAFKAYSTEVNKLDAQAKRVGKTADEMEKKGGAYFAAWEKKTANISNVQMRAKAAERRAALTASFERIGEAYGKLDDSYPALMADLKDIESFLSSELTGDSVDAISDQMDKSGTDAETVKAAIVDVTQVIDDVVREFGRQAPPPEA